MFKIRHCVIKRTKDSGSEESATYHKTWIGVGALAKSPGKILLSIRPEPRGGASAGLLKWGLVKPEQSRCSTERLTIKLWDACATRAPRQST